MRIAQVVCTFPPYKGGIGNVVYNYSLQLAQQGHDVAVFTPEYVLRESKNIPNYGFKTVKIRPLIKYGNGAFIPGLFFKLKNYDIMHLHLPFFGGAEVVWLAKLTHRTKIKLVLHYHMDIIGMNPFIRLLSLPSALIKASLFKLADAVTCASLDYAKNSNIKHYYYKYKNKFYEIPFGVDADKFRPGDLTTRRKVGPRNILFVGGLDKAHYFKGVNTLLIAVSKLHAANFKLQIVGNGDMRIDHESRAKKLGIGDKVEFRSSVNNNELVKYYQNADVFVLPSINRHEAFGLVLLEAMACGTPVIASDLPGVRHVFENNKQGFLVEPGSAEDLSSKLYQILFDNEKRETMAGVCRSLVLNKYSWDNAAKELVKVYERIIKKE